MAQTFEHLEAAAFEQFQKCKGAAWEYLRDRAKRASSAEIERDGDNLYGQCVTLWVLLSRMPGDKRDVSVFFKRKRGDILGVDTLDEEGNAWFLGNFIVLGSERDRAKALNRFYDNCNRGKED
jgi:hypothetical protein